MTRVPFVVFTACGLALAACSDAGPYKGETIAFKGGDAETGREMAQELCSRCHNVTKQGDSPVADAPPFRLLSHLWPLSHMEEALAEGIMVGHPVHRMPVFQFMPNEIADLLAYIESIQDPNPPEPAG